MPGEAKPVLLPDFILLEKPWWPVENLASQTALTGTYLSVWKSQAAVSQMCDALHSHERVMSSQREDPPDNCPASGSFSYDDAIHETLTPY